MRCVIAAVLISTLTASPQGRLPQFEVASIKRNVSGRIGFTVQPLRAGRASLTNVTVRMLLFHAFEITADTPIDGLPSWADTERHDVEARTTTNPSVTEQREMWRALLVDRLHLRSHPDTRSQEIYNLVLARPDKGTGPGLAPSTLSCPERAQPPEAVALSRNSAKLLAGLPPRPTGQGQASWLTAEFVAERLNACGTFTTTNTILSGSMSMGGLAQHLTGLVDRMVVDETGLMGVFSIRMVAWPGDVASLFTVLQEQLGLKLDSARAPVDVLVIDQIERPTEN
jgi:uncharacterized protein (TIGR03435 family)